MIQAGNTELQPLNIRRFQTREEHSDRRNSTHTEGTASRWREQRPDGGNSIQTEGTAPRLREQHPDRENSTQMEHSDGGNSTQREGTAGTKVRICQGAPLPHSGMVTWVLQPLARWDFLGSCLLHNLLWEGVRSQCW